MTLKMEGQPLQQVFVGDEFRSLRRLSFGAWTSTAVSFGLFYR